MTDLNDTPRNRVRATDDQDDTRRIRASEPPKAKRVRCSDPVEPPKGARVRLYDTATATGAATATATGHAATAKRSKAKRNVMTLTESRIAALRIDKHRAFYVWDHGSGAQRGLAVMVMPSGAKSFTAHFNFPRQPTRGMVIGRVGEMSLADARARTGAIRGKAREGVDPRADDPTRSLSFAELVGTWHRREQVGRKSNVSADATKGLVLHHCKARFGSRPAGTIRFAEIDDLLTELRDDKKQGATAARMFSHLRSIFAWAVATRRLAVSPMAGMLAPCKVQRRALDWFRAPASDDVIKGLWALGGELGGDREKFVKLLILTGKRRNAVATMRWEAIDSTTWLWTPPAGSRSKRNNPIGLPKLAQRVLGTHKGSGPVMAMTDAAVQELTGIVRERLELPDYIAHGLRHIMTTGLARLKVSPHIARLAMDHAGPSDVHASYEHVDWSPEIAAAMEAWASFVEALIAPAEGVRMLR